MLSSIFYEPSVPCNLVSPWLQSIFAVLDSEKIRNDDRVPAHMLMNRVPSIAFLWLGAIVLGIHRDVLRDGRFGLVPVDLHAAMWSGTVQSFIQEPVSSFSSSK